jgi:glycosyltransferase involved in cell wall biosynthesis
LLSLLKNLNSLAYPVSEVIIVDSGEEPLAVSDYEEFSCLAVQYVRSEKSVCVQRNTGIRRARSEWILLCDDDIELPVDYLNKLAAHITACPDTGAVSGIVLQKVDGQWEGKYNEQSALMLCWKYLFQLGIWGEITCRKNFITRRIRTSYYRKGNHISKAGWPVLVNFSGDCFTSPVYALGASLIKREWLLKAPFDEVLDRHGIGDHFGVALKFPGPVYVLNSTQVYHHQEATNRLNRRLQYYRRALALDYFVTTTSALPRTGRGWLLWSLFGNFLLFLFSSQGFMVWPAFKAFSKILMGKNPYLEGMVLNARITEPLL